MSRSLSPRQREIAVLVVLHRLTYREIADELGISYHTVLSHVEAIPRIDGETPQKAMARYCREQSQVA